MRYLYIGYNGWLSLKNWGQSVKVRNLPYPFLRGQPLKLRNCVTVFLKSDHAIHDKHLKHGIHLVVKPFTFFNNAGILQVIWEAVLGWLVSCFVHAKVIECGGNNKSICLCLEKFFNLVVIVTKHITKCIAITWDNGIRGISSPVTNRVFFAQNVNYNLQKQHMQKDI